MPSRFIRQDIEVGCVMFSADVMIFYAIFLKYILKLNLFILNVLIGTYDIPPKLFQLTSRIQLRVHKSNVDSQSFN